MSRDQIQAAMIDAAVLAAIIVAIFLALDWGMK